MNNDGFSKNNKDFFCTLQTHWYWFVTILHLSLGLPCKVMLSPHPGPDPVPQPLLSGRGEVCLPIPLKIPPFGEKFRYFSAFSYLCDEISYWDRKVVLFALFPL
jgi:hypothetical protein